MNFPWGNVFDYFKERRTAGVFLVSLAISIGLLLVGLIFPQVIRMALPVAGLLFAIWLVRGVIQARRLWRDRYKTSPLSGHDLNQARNRLMRGNRRSPSAITARPQGALKNSPAMRAGGRL